MTILRFKAMNDVHNLYMDRTDIICEEYFVKNEFIFQFKSKSNIKSDKTKNVRDIICYKTKSYFLAFLE